ncbi:hypothetical protein NOF04DRAFT_1337921 [Fusarium oxysporum II5]|uniref:Uncharacterized protein n=1 Tax=Fusarium oxysporum f. sp. cubense TaxID=61366 RepID=A0A559LJJ0_FUSOC|nr:hypothetical protein NOF04DRAFT_1337921 [Fusarium oxysporum II5]TVY74442.1 hypothetical protein Focb16_v006085 [Fusarium oxysporum f. sp. cubense]
MKKCPKIASATSQIISGFRHLSESLVRAELDEIRVSLVGRVKIVVQTSSDWLREQPMGPGISEYWHATFINFFHSMLPKRNGRPFVSELADDFLRASATCIPSHRHEFLKLSRGTDGLAPRAKFRYGCLLSETNHKA